MTIGFPGKNGVRTADLDECQNIMDVFLQHGHKELDTAGVYAGKMSTYKVGRLGDP